MKADIVIVGAGAAGLATSLFAARRNPSASIQLLDGAKKPGAKILVSGGGRCNVTNVSVSESDFFGGNRNVIRNILKRYPAESAVAFFREIGVPLHEEAFGKLFPDSNKAKTVLDALLGEAEKCGVAIKPDHHGTAITRSDDGFSLTTSQGTISASRMVLATGGLSLPKTGSDGGGYRLAESLGHSLVPQTPGLEPLLLEGDFHVPLSGISQDVEISVRVEGEKAVRLTGPMLWTHFGISGPAPMNASRIWHRAKLNQHPVQVQMSFLPGKTFERAEEQFLKLDPKGPLQKALATVMPNRVATAILTYLKLNPETQLGQCPRDDRRNLLRHLLEWPLPVSGGRGYNYAEVTAGGIPLEEVHTRTLESRKCPGLYFVGEILDVDGLIGGYNFQWSWSTAWVAATALTTPPA